MTRPFIDVVVTTPGSQHGPKSLRVPGHVANLLSINKTRDYERHFDFTPASMVRFYPFSVEVFGSLGTEAVKVIHWLASLAYPLQEVDGEPRDVDGRRSFYITRMFARLSAALAEAQSERIAAWIDRLLRKRGELVMLAYCRRKTFLLCGKPSVLHSFVGFGMTWRRRGVRMACGKTQSQA